jgi:hypothetical protein
MKPLQLNLSQVGSEVEVSIGHVVERLFNLASSTFPTHLLPYSSQQPAMSLETLIYRPLLLLIHTTDLLLNIPSLIHSSTQRTPNRPEKGAVPRHVAFSFVTPDHSDEAVEMLKDVVRDLAAWAAEVGVEEVSLWSEDGESLVSSSRLRLSANQVWVVGLFDDGVIEK